MNEWLILNAKIIATIADNVRVDVSLIVLTNLSYSFSFLIAACEQWQWHYRHYQQPNAKRGG